MWYEHLGRTDLAWNLMTLTTTGAGPIISSPSSDGPKARNRGKTEIDKVLRMNGIELAKSKWASPIVFVPKKDGWLPSCVNYKNPNSVTIKEAYPIPVMDEFLDSLGETPYSWRQMPVPGSAKLKATAGKRTKRRLHRAMDCTYFYECGSVWRTPQAPSNAWCTVHYTVNRQVEFCACIPGWGHHLLEVHRRTSGPFTESTGTTVESGHII